jgi:peptide/nickel transport system permease protein
MSGPGTSGKARSTFSDSRVALGTALLVSVLALAAFAPMLAPHDPNDQDLVNALLPPAWSAGGDWGFPLGTDSLGRCVLSRVIYGARVAVLVGTLAPIGTLLVGVSIAVVAGYAGGWVDRTISRLVDIWMSFPPVVMALVLMIGLSSGLKNVIIAIVVVDWTRFCRVVRGETLVLARQDYVPAARIAGAPHWRVVAFEILPGLFPTVITLFTIEIGIAIIIESVLSFVGVAMAPDVPTWGMMIADGLVTMFQQPVALAAPMVAIIVTVLGANTLGDGLRRTLDPRLVSHGGAP